MHYHPITAEDKIELLKEIGVRSFDDLLKGIPESLRHPQLNIPEALSEWDLRKHLQETLGRNKHMANQLCFLGGGSYEHFVPAAVSQIISRNEFYTAYTPYQPEASQGTLQTIFEYQSLMAELTGLDVSNASHYDGATSLAEAVLMILKHADRTHILMSKAVHPHYRQTVKTYLRGTPYKVVEFAFDERGEFNRDELNALLNDQVAGAVLQTPNFFGVLENLNGVSDTLHEIGAYLILVSNPISLGALRSPGEWGADVAVGEGQSLGIRAQFGGPYLGYFTTTKALMRKIPGRLAGISEDTKGRRAYVLTLRAREQDIRRERSSSNICSNQALCALAACVYMTILGKQGMREVAELNIDRAVYLRNKISGIKGYSVNENTSIFNEFVVKLPIPFAELEAKMLAQNIQPGIHLAKYYPDMKNSMLVCATETKSKADLDRFVEALRRC